MSVYSVSCRWDRHSDCRDPVCGCTCHLQGRRGEMKVVVVGIWLALMLLAYYDGPDLSESTHEGETTLHCPQDVNADHWIDMFDLVEFGNYFGQPSAPAHLDIDPPLVGDGVVSFIDEITTVAGHFGQSCIGNSGTLPDQPDPPAPPEGFALGWVPRAFGCGLQVHGFDGVIFPGGPTGQMIGIPGYPLGGPDRYWGGNVGCYLEDGFNYHFTCWYEWLQVVNGWEVVSASSTGYAQSDSNDAALICSVPHSENPAFIPCSYTTLGWVYLRVQYQRPGFGWHDLWTHFMPEGGFGFNPC